MIVIQQNISGLHQLEKKNPTNLTIFAIEAILVTTGYYHTIENPGWPLGTHIYLKINKVMIKIKTII